jgi:hypothetical protein
LTIWHNKRICIIFVIVEFTKQFIMAKAKKLSPEELEGVQSPVNNINNLYMSIGRTMVGALRSLSELDALEKTLQEAREALEAKYGSVTINLVTGEYEEVIEEAETVEE